MWGRMGFLLFNWNFLLGRDILFARAEVPPVNNAKSGTGKLYFHFKVLFCDIVLDGGQIS